MLEKFDPAIIFRQPNDHRLAHGEHLDHLAFTQRRYDPLFDLRQLLAGLHVLLVFVHQAASQPPAHPCDLLRTEGYALRLGHLDRDWAELRQEHGAAARFQPAGTHPTDNLSHIPGADLPKLHARFFHGALHGAAQPV